MDVTKTSSLIKIFNNFATISPHAFDRVCPQVSPSKCLQMFARYVTAFIIIHTMGAKFKPSKVTSLTSERPDKFNYS